MSSSTRAMKPIFLVLLGFTLVLASCYLPLGSGSGEDDLGIPEGMGAVRVSLPDPLAGLDPLPAGSSIPSSKAFTPRAIAGRDRILVELRDAGNALADSIEILGSGPYSSEGILIAAPGSGYTLSVSVYDTDTSETLPVVAGQSAAFEIVAAVVADVTVTCLPVAASELAEASPVDLDLAVGQCDLGTGLMTVGQEAWFHFTASTDATFLRYKPVNPDQRGFMCWLFDETGTGLGMGYLPGLWSYQDGWSAAEQADSLVLDTVSGSSYYLAVASMDLSFACMSVGTGGPFELAIAPAVDSSVPLAVTGNSSGAAIDFYNDSTYVEGYYLRDDDSSATLTVNTTLDVSFDGGLTIDADKELVLPGFESGDEVSIYLSDGFAWASRPITLYKAVSMTAGVWTEVDVSFGETAYAYLDISAFPADTEYLANMNDLTAGSGTYGTDAVMTVMDKDGFPYYARDIDAAYAFPRQISPGAFPPSYLIVTLEKKVSTSSPDGPVAVRIAEATGFASSYSVTAEGDFSGAADILSGGFSYWNWFAFLNPFDFTATITVTADPGVSVSFNGGISADADGILELSNWVSGQYVTILLADGTGVEEYELTLYPIIDLTEGVTADIPLVGYEPSFARFEGLLALTDYSVAMDDATDGSGTYTGDGELSVYDSLGNSYYTWEDACYTSPLSVSIGDPAPASLIMRLSKYGFSDPDDTVGLRVSGP